MNRSVLKTDRWPHIDNLRLRLESSNKEDPILSIHMQHLLHSYGIKGTFFKVTRHENCRYILPKQKAKNILKCFLFFEGKNLLKKKTDCTSNARLV